MTTDERTLAHLCQSLKWLRENNSTHNQLMGQMQAEIDRLATKCGEASVKPAAQYCIDVNGYLLKNSISLCRFGSIAEGLTVARRCNLHDELVESLEDMLSASGLRPGDEVVRAEALIAKVRGQS